MNKLRKLLLLIGTSDTNPTIIRVRKIPNGDVRKIPTGAIRSVPKDA